MSKTKSYGKMHAIFGFYDSSLQCQCLSPSKRVYLCINLNVYALEAKTNKQIKQAN